jgi:hypothetical protein
MSANSFTPSMTADNVPFAVSSAVIDRRYSYRFVVFVISLSFAVYSVRVEGGRHD